MLVPINTIYGAYILHVIFRLTVTYHNIVVCINQKQSTQKQKLKQGQSAEKKIGAVERREENRGSTAQRVTAEYWPQPRGQVPPAGSLETFPTGGFSSQWADGMRRVSTFIPALKFHYLLTGVTQNTIYQVLEKNRGETKWNNYT